MSEEEEHTVFIIFRLKLVITCPVTAGIAFRPLVTLSRIGGGENEFLKVV